MSDTVLQLQQPLKEGAIRSVNFFNGRLLTSKDLTREQQARREADWRTGLAIGDGVAFGLEVARDVTLDQPAAPVVRVKAGLAVNRKGQTLRLPADTSVALARRFDAQTTSCVFAQCNPVGAETYVAGAGVYVLAIAPAEASEGRAPTNGLDPGNVRCNIDTTIEAVQFKLIGVSQQLLAGLNLGARDFRNALAYRCFGSPVRIDSFVNLLADLPRSGGILDDLRPGLLSDFEVPLALVYLTGTATLTFVDAWAARRSLSRRESGGLGGLVESQRPVLGEAMFRQFQRHIAELLPPSGELGAVSARGDFRFLPPVGVIPVSEAVLAAHDEARFFAGMTVRGPAFINAARAESLVRESLCFPPIDTQSPEVVFLYCVRENRIARDFNSVTPRPGAYLVFSSGHLPYRADAQFDLGFWNYSNYALGR
jgi:hypothetical protein